MDQYPIIMSEKWLFRTRLVLVISAVIIVKISQKNLPAYNIDQMHDNIFDVFFDF